MVPKINNVSELVNNLAQKLIDFELTQARNQANSPACRPLRIKPKNIPLCLPLCIVRFVHGNLVNA